MEPKSVSKNNLVEKNLLFSKEWTVSFDYKPKMTAIPGWTNIFHFTTGSNHGQCGSRYPAAWIHPNSKNKIRICSCVNNNHNHCQDYKLEDDWNTFQIGQRKSSDDQHVYFEYFIKLNGAIRHTIINDNAKEMTDLTLYASDPWHTQANGLLQNLEARIIDQLSQSKNFIGYRFPRNELFIE